MSRPYPRFLFSNPQNTKTKGPFVVYCLEPRLIFKVQNTEAHTLVKGSFRMLLTDDYPTEEVEIIRKEAETWLRNQIRLGEITL